MISTNPFLPIILMRVTPSANRNTYSVATLTQVSDLDFKPFEHTL